MTLLYIALGGALGALGRYGGMALSTRVLGHGFPYGTLLVNILGSLMIGMVIGWLAKQSTGLEAVRSLIVVGFLGSFTTFSTFSLDVVTLFERGQNMLVLAYILGSVTCSVIAVFVGMGLMRSVFA
ncbi:MAG: fluoride efflux transporter CrcB [Rickettsiales bacterium]|nr:fluoride efflux transporter CrcB [Rickettsiales bacterium]